MRHRRRCGSATTRGQLVTERIWLVNVVHTDRVIVVPGYEGKVAQLARP
jgi:hypothetical protein